MIYYGNDNCQSGTTYTLSVGTAGIWKTGSSVYNTFAIKYVLSGSTIQMTPYINGQNVLPNSYSWYGTDQQYYPNLGDAALYVKGATTKQYQKVLITSATAVKV